MKRTGNPFVDMGMSVITALVKKDKVSELTIDDIETVWEKYDLTDINDSLKSYTMVFGTNSPLKQSGYKGKNREIHRFFLEELLREMKKNSTGLYCEICGEAHNFQLNVLWAKVAKRFELKEGDKKIGRDLFPLIGSIGNDAQVFPSASKTYEICPRCLYAVNYIPVGTMLIKGRLTCIESTSEELMTDLVEEIVETNLKRYRAGNKEIYGKKEGNSALYIKLMDRFSKLRYEIKKEDLAETTAIYLWLFSNAGTGPDCDLIEIPNKSLKFFWDATDKEIGFKTELLNLINLDEKGIIFDCINNNSDYYGLYPRKNIKGVSHKLYKHYQLKIVGKSIYDLRFANKIATKMLEEKSEKDSSALQRSDVFDKGSKINAKIIARKAVVELCMEGEIKLDDYLSFFNMQENRLDIDYNAYKMIMYYLVNDSIDRGELAKVDVELKSKKTDEKIKAFSELYFKYYVCDKENGLGRGIIRFKKDILDDMQNKRKFWLQNAFVKIAEIYENDELKLDYDGWLEFITDDEGNERVNELLFQLRLAFANLYYEYKKEDEGNE